MINLLDLTLHELEAWLRHEGEKPIHAGKIFSSIHKKHLLLPQEMLNLPNKIRLLLLQKTHITLPTVHSEKISTDGTVKWLFLIDDRHLIETVYIPEKHRGTLCVSSQAGCALKCTFCSTGKQGFQGNLAVKDIVGQMLFASIRILMLSNDITTEKKITNVVFMGMGEPLLNFEAVKNAISVFLSDHAYGLAKKKITVSTSGVIPYIDRLSQEMPVSLAISLHATNDALRTQLMPINKKYPLSALLDSGLRYIRFSPKPFITLEYTMMDRINDSDQHLKELIDISHKVPSKINLISWNRFPDAPYHPSLRTLFFFNTLSSHGIVTTIRRTRGDDIDAACGQLAGQITDRRKESIHWIKRVGDSHA